MGFLSIGHAIYDYQPQSGAELEFSEGELLYILDKSGGDDWWRAKKRAAEDDDEEPEGLIPINYVRDATPVATARALYDYGRQTEEEVTFEEDATLDVYDTSDPDWTLVGVNGEFGFAPANYIELTGSAPKSPAVTSPTRSVEQSYPSPTSPGTAGAASNLAAVMGGKAPEARPALPSRNSAQPQQVTPEESDSDEGPPPALPARPLPQSTSWSREDDEEEPLPGVQSSPPYNRAGGKTVTTASGFRLYNISEMMSVMGRRKKMPTTLGLNITTGVVSLMPETSGSKLEWSSDKISHYSIEGKHVFLELIRPARSLDLHAGSKDTAEEIVSTLGEIVGATRAAGFKEVVAAASGGQRKGVALYDFMAQGDDEVTVAAGDEVIVLDDTKSEEWWNVRRLKNGAEGVMPSSYVEVTGPAPAETTRSTRSTVEQNRQEEERMTRESARSRARDEERQAPPMTLPERGSSLGDEDTRRHKKKSSKTESKSKSKPDTAKVRTWTDRSGTFKVDAQFVGLADGKIHLHKVNGVRIAVPISKMSPTDLDYVEKVIKEPVEDHMAVADLIKMKRRTETRTDTRGATRPETRVDDDEMAKAIGASLESSAAEKTREPDYDWFEFFLKAGVGPHQCERYAQAMAKDAMDETVLPDITQGTLRTLGLKEGDALKVMKYLDGQYGRAKTADTNGEGGLFTGPGGALKTNRTRPEANRTVSDVVDAEAFASGDTPKSAKSAQESGFENDATWTVQRPKQAAAPPKAPSPAPVAKAQSGGLIDVSVLHNPIAPTPAPKQQTPQPTGATPSFFDNVAEQRNQPQGVTANAILSPPPRPTSAPQYAQQAMMPQITGVSRAATNQAPMGQSMDELTALRMQQQYQQYLQSQPTGYGGYGLMPQPTGYGQPYLNGNAVGSPFADPRGFQPQPTGYQPGMAPGNMIPIIQPQKTGYAPQQQQFSGPNGYGGLQPQPTGYQPMFQSMQPQPTGYQPQMMPQQTGYQQSQQNGFGNYQQAPPPMPPMPRQPSLAPLMPQKTGPPPPVKFGVEANRLVAQPTGRRANLSQATPQNPFGF